MVVGLGAAGAIAAHVLTAAGVRVVALEAGGATPDRVDAGADPEPPTVRRRAGDVAVPDPEGAAAGAGRGVGGAKARSAGQSFRLEADAMRLRSAVEERLGPRALPPDVTVADWPLTPAELEPYHRHVERLFRVAGAPGGAPALPGTPWTALMGEAAERLGWSPFAAPVAVVSPGVATHRPGHAGARGGGDAARREAPGAADGGASPAPASGPPGIASMALLRPAVDAGLLIVRTGARVLRVTTGADGAVDGVEVLRDGRRAHQPARAVVLAASVLANVRLLLLSRSAVHPAGLGNRSGQAGRHYATHAVATVHGWFPGRDLGRAAGPPGQAVATAVFDRPVLTTGGPAGGDANAHDDDGRAGRPVLGGSILQAAMGTTSSATLTALGLGPGDAASVGTVWAQPEQLPRDAHLLDLDPDHRDDLGRPLLRVTHDLATDDRARAALLQERMERWLREAGATRIVRSPVRPSSLGTHRYGGTRMGADPATSVVAADGAVHGVPGLVVAGASTFPSTGGRGPTQTVEALAWLAAERLAARLGVPHHG